MSDSDDADLENLRQLALSSLLKKKSVPLQTNALFYRPVSNSNLISIQPVNGIDSENDDADAGAQSDGSDEETSSGSEYAVIEEGLSVSSGDVDQVIEEVIVSEEENSSQSDSEEEEDAEDAVSIASHDSFDEILNSVEEEIRGSKRRPSTGGDAASGPSDSKRPRSDQQTGEKASNPLPTRQRNRSRSPNFPDSYRRVTTSRQGSRRPLSPHSPNYFRDRSSKSPRNVRRYRSPLRRRPSRSPAENKQWKPDVRKKSPSPTSLRKNEMSTISRDFYSRSSDNRRPTSRNGSRSQPGSDTEKPLPLSSKRISDNKTSNRQRSSEHRRSRSPRNKLSFGDHRLRINLRDSKKNSLPNSSRHASRERTSRSPIGCKRRGRSKSPPRKAAKTQLVRTRSPSPVVDISNLTDEERMRIEKRRLKFKSEASQSGKVILKVKEDSAPVEQKARVPKVPITFESVPAKKADSKQQKPSPGTTTPITTRLGRESAPDEDEFLRRHHRQENHPKSRPNPAAPKQPSMEPNSEEAVDDVSNNNSPKRSLTPTTTRSSPTKSIGEDDLRTKLQQKRAANVGRIFSVALKDTLHRESTSTSPRP